VEPPRSLFFSYSHREVVAADWRHISIVTQDSRDIHVV